MLMFKVMA